MGGKNLLGGARLATAVGLGLALALGAAPIMATAEEPETAIPVVSPAVEPDVAETLDSATSILVDGQSFSGTLAQAFKDAPGDGTTRTITLTDNVECGGFSDYLTVDSGRSVVLDLNGHTLIIAASTLAMDQETGLSVANTAIVSRGTLIVRNGTIDVTGPRNAIVSFGSLTIEDDASIVNDQQKYSGQYLITNFGGTVVSSGNLVSSHNNGISTYGGSLQIDGGQVMAEDVKATGITIFSRSATSTGDDGAAATITKATIQAGDYAISTNNSMSANSSLTLVSGSLASDATAIYWPGMGSLTIGDQESGDGPTIVSAHGTAVEVCSGSLTIYGGTFEGGTEMGSGDSYTTDEALVAAYRTNSGSPCAGDAVAIISRRGDGYASASLSVNIHGGTFSSPQNYGVRYLDCNEIDGAVQVEQGVSVSVAGGDFSGGIAAVDASFVNSDDSDIVSGGIFSSPLPVAYLADGMTHQLKSDEGYAYFASEEAALEQAGPGDVVTSVSDDGESDKVSLVLDDGVGTSETVTAAKGALYVLPKPVRAGYTFRGWSDGTRVYQVGQTYTVSGNVTLTALWQSNYVPPVASGHEVKAEQSEGGKVTVTPERAEEGDEVTITATPDEGQEVRSVTVKDGDGNEVEVKRGEKDGEFVFAMPDGAVTVTVTFGCDGGELCPTHGFADVDQSAWYHDAVDWAVEHHVLNGYGDGGTTLGPVADVTRAEMAQMRWNQANRPEADADLASFTDVDPEGWYADALAWCLDEGLFSGYGDTFGTERVISREEAATVLWRLAGSPEADADLSGYGDASKVSSYAEVAMKWAVSEGVLTGKGGVSLDPQGQCTRGEVAAMLMRMSE